MRQRSERPSRLIQSVARWAITLGAAGTIVAATALYNVLFGKELVSSKHNLLLLAATLLALAFVLAPFVRHTFNFVPKPHKSEPPRTLLDEMRVGSEPASGEAAAPVAEDHVQPTTNSSTARLVAAVYVTFALTLLTILWALQSN